MELIRKLYKIMNEKPEHTILHVDDQTFTYAHINERIGMWKDELKKYGVCSRAKIIAYMKNTIDIVGLYFALCELDCIFIPVDVSAKVSTINDIIKSSNANFVISLQKLNLDQFQREIQLSCGNFLYETLNNINENDTPSEIMQFLYTSGTTGLPKCVMFTKDNMSNNIIKLADALALSDNDVIYTPISLMLPAALNTVLLPAMLSGTRVFVSESTVPGSVLRNIIKQRVTVFFSVPFYYKLLLSNKLCTEDTWKNVRLCLTSSAYLGEATFNDFYNETKKGLHSIYCSSEAGTIAYNASQDTDKLCRFVGKSLPGCEVSLINTNTEGVGEIVVRGGMISLKYYENEELNKEVYINGWVRTGDLGVIYDDGYIEIKGRVSETINIAGHLVNPLEVEKVILKIDAIQDVIAYKYMNKVNNEMLGIKVVLKEGTSVSEKAIIDYCKSVLPSYKVPKQVQFVDGIDIGRYGKKRRI